MKFPRRDCRLFGRLGALRAVENIIFMDFGVIVVLVLAFAGVCGGLGVLVLPAITASVTLVLDNVEP